MILSPRFYNIAPHPPWRPSERAAFFCFRLLILSGLCLPALFLSGCGGGLPAGKINPLPIDIVRDDPPDKDKRRSRFRRYGGSRGGGGGSDDSEDSPEEISAQKCRTLSSLIESENYGAAAEQISTSDPAIGRILQSGDKAEAGRLLSILFSKSSCQ